MRLLSTNGRTPATDLGTALLEGLAPDGGLYLPERFTPMADGTLEGLRGRSFSDVAREVARHLLGAEITPSDVDALVESALDFPVPLVELEPDVYVLELFHGPTLAFKDVGARFMARLLGHVREEDEGALTVLVATSGDTGSAVAHAFLDAAGVRTVVLFPSGKVSALQERQFTTLGGNVRALEVDGTFDDCQRLVKDAFADEELRAQVRLTSANSINVGRLLPQIFYYVHAWAQLPKGLPPIFSVPSGNFGNLTGGLIAKRLGAPGPRIRGGHERERHGARIPMYRGGKAPGLHADDIERHGRRRPEQPGSHPCAVRRRPEPPQRRRGGKRSRRSRDPAGDP